VHPSRSRSASPRTLAICDTPASLPWLSVGQTLGTTVGGATTVVDVTFDSTGLAPGVYSGRAVRAEQRSRRRRVVAVPVSFVVAVLLVDGFESGDTANWSVSVP
jgi:hypothetical protein